MKIRFLGICCLSVLIFGVVSHICAQATNPININRSTVSGYVFGPHKTRVAQIRVELLNEFNRVLARTQTDGSGRYYFRGIPSSGRFSVKVLPLGLDFEEQTQDFEISGFNPAGIPMADNIQLDFYLKSGKTDTNLVVAPGTIFVETVSEEAKKSYEKAIIDLDAKRTDAGIEKLKHALELSPSYYAASERLGIEYLGKGKFEEARNVFTVAVATNPRGFSSWYGLAYADFELEKNEATLEAIEKALLLMPRSVEALLLRGLALRKLKRYVDAEGSLIEAKKYDNGKTPAIHWNLALLYAHNLKRYKDAGDELELYLKADPSAPNKDAVKKLIKKFHENPNAADQ